MRLILFVANIACFSSFGWAMARHFEPGGKPKPGMLLTAAAAPVFAAIQLWATLRLPLPGALAALLLDAAAATMFWSAISATRGRGLAACFQAKVPMAVVTAGPYRFTRHPFYLSYLLVWTGGFVASGSLPQAAIAIFMGALYFRAARQEERTLLNSPLRDAYYAYIRKPGLGWND
jgi:protein-S-isoprenylcysteine O-methyltransferase Ste14